MRIILCPYCGEHLKERLPCCPACNRTLPERASDDDLEPPQFLASDRIARGSRAVDNRIPEHLFMHAFIVGTVLVIVGGIGTLWIDGLNGIMTIIFSPGLGLFIACFVLVGFNTIASLYETLAGPDPRLEVPPDTRDRTQYGPVANDRHESIRTAEAQPHITDRAAQEPPPCVAEQPKLPPSPPAWAPPKATPFWPVFFMSLAAVSALGYFAGGTVGHAVLLGFLVGVPTAFVLGALAVRWSRSRQAGRESK